MRVISLLRLMFKASRTLWKLIYLNRNAKIKWVPPQQSKIVVFDACGLETLEPLFEGKPYEIIHTRGEQVHVTVAILVATFLNLGRVCHPFAAYVLALIQHVRPSIVVTFIDNNGLFGLAAQHYPEARFLAIQNGMRCITRDNPSGTRPVHLPEFACFGQHEIDIYTKHGAAVSRFYPIGSLKDSYYRENRTQGIPQAKFDLCLISEADPDLARAYPEIEHSIRQLAKYVSKFCQRTNQRLCVAARNDPIENQEGFSFELQWYRNHIGHEVNLIRNRREEFTTYRLIDSSSVSLSFYSTALVEAFGRGNRSLFCNFAGDDYYDLPVGGLWFLKQPSYEEFEERLLQLLRMTDQEFKESSAKAANYMMNFDQVNPPHEFLRKLLADAVNK